MKRHRLISAPGWKVFELSSAAALWDGLVSVLPMLEAALATIHTAPALPEWMRTQVAHLTLPPIAALPTARPPRRFGGGSVWAIDANSAWRYVRSR